MSMDALEFAKERKRMCNAYKNCGDCPLAKSCCTITHATSDEDCKRIVATVEQWSKEHPRKTRQSVFLEQWPEAGLNTDGVLRLCPKSVSAAYRNNDSRCLTITCCGCRRKFWMQEVE